MAVAAWAAVAWAVAAWAAAPSLPGVQELADCSDKAPAVEGVMMVVAPGSREGSLASGEQPQQLCPGSRNC